MKKDKISSSCVRCGLSIHNIIPPSFDRDYKSLQDPSYSNSLSDNEQNEAESEPTNKYSWQILECAGCLRVSFRSSSISWPEGNAVEDIIYPPNLEHKRKDFKNVYPKLNELYVNTVMAYNMNMYILCATGLRTIIEGLCVHKGVESGKVLNKETNKTKESSSLEGKIAGLAEKEILTKNNAQKLNAFRFMGNKAIHELDPPPKDQLSISLQIIESVFDNVFELEEKFNELERKGKQGPSPFTR